MKLQMIGCSHHNSKVEIRERLSFSSEQARLALASLRQRYPQTEVVLLSTCNRVELYTASMESNDCPTHHDVVQFLAEFHGLDAAEIFDDLFERTGDDAVRHLFTVAASLDSMVVGEAQILSQVKQAYELACEGNAAATLMHSAFQAANRVAKRVATETSIHQKRVSIPSVAVSDFAKQFFERFDDKRVLVLGAGEMGEEALRYLMDEGARDVTILNRTLDRSQQLVRRTCGRALPWECLGELLVKADLVISTTGSSEPIVTSQAYARIERQRFQHPLFVLDLAIPRDFDPAIGDFNSIYLYSIDDLKKVCEANRRKRQQEWPKAERIIEEETARYMKELNHRATGPTIRRLKARAEEVKVDELQRLLNKMDDLEPHQQQEITRAFDRLVNKLLHPPLESLRDESQRGSPQSLLEALKQLFQLKD